MKRYVLGFLATVFLFAAPSYDSATDDLSSPRRAFKPVPTAPTPTPPTTVKPAAPAPPQGQEPVDYEITCRVEITRIEPSVIVLRTRQITVSYSLLCRGPSRVGAFSVKVGLLIDNQLKGAQILRNVPNGRSAPFFMRAPYIPDAIGEHRLSLRVVRTDIDPARVTPRTQRGREFYGSAEQTIRVGEDIDLAISASDVTIRPESPLSHHEFFVEAVLRNEGADRVKDVEVLFAIFEGGTQLERRTRKVTWYIPAGGAFTFNERFAASERKGYELRVVVDPNRSIDETNERNNTVIKRYSVIVAETVVHFTPRDGATNVAINPRIEVEFSRGISDANVVIQPPFPFTKSLAETTLTIEPTERLNLETTYRITIHVVGGLDHTFTFTTVKVERHVFFPRGMQSHCMIPQLVPYSSESVVLIGDYEGSVYPENRPYAYCQYVDIYFEERYPTSWSDKEILTAELNILAYLTGDPFAGLGRLHARAQDAAFNAIFAPPSAEISAIKAEVTPYIRNLVETTSSPEPRVRIIFDRPKDNDNKNDYLEFGRQYAFGEPTIEVRYIPSGQYGRR